MFEFELRTAAANGDLETVNRILETDKVQINAGGKGSGNTALHFAALASNPKQKLHKPTGDYFGVIKLLLEKGAKKLQGNAEKKLAYQLTDNAELKRILFSEADAATILQSAIRSYAIRRQYNIEPLAKNQLTDYKANFSGNDPEILGLSSYKAKKGKVAIISTSSMRVILLACQLGNEKEKITPKIILIDNSKNVYALWQAVKELVFKCDTKKTFERNLPKFISQIEKFCNPEEESAQQKIAFIQTLLKQYDYQYIRSIILNAYIIRQDWQDEITFIKVKNILNYLDIENIYVYSSNIVANLEGEQPKDRVLSNIKKLNPQLSIHTDFCYIIKTKPIDAYKGSRNFYLCSNQDTKFIKDQLFPKGNTLNLPNATIELNELIRMVLDKIGGPEKLATGDIYSVCLRIGN